MTDLQDSRKNRIEEASEAQIQATEVAVGDLMVGKPKRKTALQKAILSALLDSSKYRVRRAPEYLAHKDARKKSKRSTSMKKLDHEDDNWLWEISCRKTKGAFRNHIYAHGLTTLAFTGNSRHLFRKAMEVNGVKVHQVGDDEFTVVFSPDLIETLTPIIKPQMRKKAPKRA